MRDTVTLDGDGAGTTEGYYHHIDSLEFPNTGLTIDTAIDLDIVAEPGLKLTKFSARDAIFPGWTTQGIVGGVPRLGWGVVPASARLDVGDTIRLLMETLALGSGDVGLLKAVCLWRNLPTTPHSHHNPLSLMSFSLLRRCIRDQRPRHDL